MHVYFGIKFTKFTRISCSMTWDQVITHTQFITIFACSQKKNLSALSAHNIQLQQNKFKVRQQRSRARTHLAQSSRNMSANSWCEFNDCLVCRKMFRARVTKSIGVFLSLNQKQTQIRSNFKQSTAQNSVYHYSFSIQITTTITTTTITVPFTAITSNTI